MRRRWKADLQSRYGADSVSQIATFGTMAAKAVVRDVGRVLGFPYGFVDQLAKPDKGGFERGEIGDLAADMHVDAGDFDAVAALENAAVIDGAPIEARLHLAQALIAKGDTARAREQLDAIITAAEAPQTLVVEARRLLSNL